MKVAILRDDNPESSRKWEIACRNQGVDFKTINMLRSDWLTQLNTYEPNFCVGRPPGDIQKNKTVYDEKVFYIENFTPFQVFPNFLETFIYENKSSLAWFLKANNIPHPDTFVSASFDDALTFIDEADYPIVAKTLIGAAGSGVKMLHSKDQADAYTKKAFTTGIKRRFGPNRKTGSPKSWFVKAVQSPDYFFKKLKQYRNRDKDVQKGLVFFQKYIDHPFEWRCVKIGESYFAYKKLKIGDQASGSKAFEYGPPPLELLDFTKDLCETYGFNFMAVDLFASESGFLVNELQTIFGHKNPYICKVDGKPGRYIFQDNQWVFEPGDFNTNESYDLRLTTAISLYDK
jgi:hypothetical protein